jgi:NitT/TauT family transport system substrate-binding protein
MPATKGMQDILSSCANPRKKGTIMTMTHLSLNRRALVAGGGAAMINMAAPWVRRAAAETEKVRMACWSPRLAEQANIYVSEQKGFFTEQGVEMEFLPGQGSGDALRNVLAGNADIAFCGPEALYLAADKGSQLKAVYDIYPVNVFNVFALKAKQIVTPQDLKGKKVGVISMASGTRYNLATILALNGMSERDVELVALGLNAAPAIMEGKVDAMASTDSILHNMQAAGLGEVDVIWARDYLNTSTDLFTVEAKTFEQRKDAITRFLRAYKKGLEYTLQNPDEAVAITTKVAVDGKDPARVAASMKLRLLCSQNANTQKNGLGWIDIPSLQKGANIYKDAGFIKSELDMNTLATNELITKL